MALSHVASASGITELVRPCSINGTIVGSVASTAYFTALLQLAGSASSHAGFPCVATMMMDSGLPPHHQIVPLPGLASDAHPRQAWCQGKMAKRHGWRRSHFYRVAMWHMIVGSGFDGRFMECSGSYAAGSWPICQSCSKKFACGSSSADVFNPLSCCWSGTRAIVCMGEMSAE